MRPQIVLLSLVLSLLGSDLAIAKSVGDAPTGRPRGTYGRLPLTFEANAGQVDSSVRFLGRSGGFTLFLTDEEAVLSLRGSAGEATLVRVHPVGGARRRPSGRDPRATRSNYLFGDDPSRWHRDVPHFGQVSYASVYPGIDLIYRGNPGQLEYDFVVAAGADPVQVRLAFQGAGAVTLGTDGALTLHTASGDLVQRAPVLYQEVGQERQPVEGGYVLLDRSGEVGFRVGRYDRSRPLVIDPIVLYSTFLGGEAFDGASGIAADAEGNAYVVGTTTSARFRGIDGSSLQPTKGDLADAFVTKIDAAGTQIVYSTFLGGNGLDEGKAIAVDSAGNAHLAGDTTSDKFPGVTAASAQPARAGAADAFVTTINAKGDGFVFSTYLGGTSGDQAQAIAVDRLGSTYVTGSTNSTPFQGVTSTSLQPLRVAGIDAFVTKIGATGAILYSTFLGGNNNEQGQGIAVDRAGNAYVTGSAGSSTTFLGVTADSLQPTNSGGIDAFLIKINSTGTAIIFSTFLGGPGDDVGEAVAADGAGNAHVTGLTRSSKFLGVGNDSLQPAGSGGSDAFVIKINALGTGILYSTFLGGPLSAQSGCCIAIDREDDAVVAGPTQAKTFPGVGRGSIQPENAGMDDFFVTKIDPAGTKILYSTFLGGPGDDSPAGMALDGAGNVYIAGTTLSGTFAGVSTHSIQFTNAGRLDAIVTKLSPLKLDPQDTGGCSVPACTVGTYPCCTSQPVCRCRPLLEGDADCTAGGKGVTGCSISLK